MHSVSTVCPWTGQLTVMKMKTFVTFRHSNPMEGRRSKEWSACCRAGQRPSAEIPRNGKEYTIPPTPCTSGFILIVRPREQCPHYQGRVPLTLAAPGRPAQH